MLSRTILIFIGLVGFAHLDTTSAQQSFRGAECPSNVKVVPNFDANKYLGTWYEIEKYPNFYEIGGKCVTANYTLLADSTLNVTDSLILKKTGVAKDVVGSLRPNGNIKPMEKAKMLFTFPATQYYNATFEYWVLDTDYTSYSVVYSCQPWPEEQHAINALILTRARVPSTDLVDNAKNVLVKNGISLKELEKTDQTGCK